MRRERLRLTRLFFPSPHGPGLTSAAPTELRIVARIALLFGCERQRRGAIQKRRLEAIRSSGRASGTGATARGKSKRARAKASGLKT
jgi:hypothetical protein